VKLIVGLGNPGPQYVRTRHNLGFEAVDLLARRLGVAFSKEKHNGLIAEAAEGAERFLLVKPMTFMNRSGDCVAALARNKVFDPADILVAVDEVALPLGRLRLRPGGSAGGHNGLKSLIERLGSPDFPRVRMGVGAKEAGRDLASHVLSRFRPEEWPAAEAMVARAADAMLCWVTHGIEETMNRYNAGPDAG
jgi:PTH1 family peptidyl-tRNA hydrolase